MPEGPTLRAPGRLGDPNLSPATDPRTRADLLAGLAPLQLDKQAAPPSFAVKRGDEPVAIVEAVAGLDAGFTLLCETVPLKLPRDDTAPSLHIVEETVVGPDGNDLHVRILRTHDAGGPSPGVLYFHGGGMVILPTRNSVHDMWREDLARAGAVAIQVGFRNAPFPTGLHDCRAVIRWADANRRRLGLSSIVLQGESGGANLVIASALLAKREGWLDAIDGVYASEPYIAAGCYWPMERILTETQSLVENDDYFVSTKVMEILAASYDPDGKHANDPLAWPYVASVDDLRSLPPHVVMVNELDPIRDQGAIFAGRLIQAGVKTTSFVNLGIVHGAEVYFREAITEVRDFVIANIVYFSRSGGKQSVRQ